MIILNSVLMNACVLTLIYLCRVSEYLYGDKARIFGRIREPSWKYSTLFKIHVPLIACDKDWVETLTPYFDLFIRWTVILAILRSCLMIPIWRVLSTPSRPWWKDSWLYGKGGSTLLMVVHPTCNSLRPIVYESVIFRYYKCIYFKA